MEKTSTTIPSQITCSFFWCEQSQLWVVAWQFCQAMRLGIHLFKVDTMEEVYIAIGTVEMFWIIPLYPTQLDFSPCLKMFRHIILINCEMPKHGCQAVNSTQTGAWEQLFFFSTFSCIMPRSQVYLIIQFFKVLFFALSRIYHFVHKGQTCQLLQKKIVW